LLFAANALVLLVALLHLWFLVLQMFLWTQPLGLSVFGITLERATATAALAANQGLYNGFLAAGLLWGLLHPVPGVGLQIKLFFLGCIIVAGLYGGYRVGRRVFYWQGAPALVAAVLLLIGR
jgi:putative membrane protein